MSKVFISYSHKDEEWKDKLLPHLKTLEMAGMGMVVWQDRQIDAGEKWHPAIQDAMAEAVAAVLLISADYLAFSFCIKEEVPYLLNRQEHEGMLLVPVLIRKCPWKAHRWLAARQMLPAMASASPSTSPAITPQASSATWRNWCWTTCRSSLQIPNPQRYC
jgi:TIR domain